jgi:hypothetical protein
VIERSRDAGSLVAACGALVLLVSLFLPWFDPGGSAWRVFEIIDLLLAGLSLVTFVLCAARWELIRPPRWAVSLWTPGAASVVLVASQLINHPPAALDSRIEGGAWVALVGALLMLAGGLAVRAGVIITIKPPEQQVATPDPAAAPPPRADVDPPGAPRQAAASRGERSPADDSH